MSRTPARFTQADVARSIRAAKQAGAAGVELRPDGTIFIALSAEEERATTKTAPEEEEVIL